MVLHLGDATDISCPDELDSVFNVLDKEAEGMWFFTPGNHDGLLAGNFANYQPDLDFDIKKSSAYSDMYEGKPINGFNKKIERAWLNACLSPTNLGDPKRANVLTKGDAIQLYINRKIPQLKMWLYTENYSQIKKHWQKYSLRIFHEKKLL